MRATKRLRMRIVKATPCKPARVSATRSSSRAKRRKHAAQALLRSTTPRVGSSMKPLFAWANCPTSRGLRHGLDSGLACWPPGRRLPIDAPGYPRPEALASRGDASSRHSPPACHFWASSAGCGFGKEPPRAPRSVRRPAATPLGEHGPSLRTHRLSTTVGSVGTRYAAAAGHAASDLCHSCARSNASPCIPRTSYGPVVGRFGHEVILGAIKAYSSSLPSVEYALRAILPMSHHQDKVHHTL
jgi:hypothetical protein